MPVVLRLDAGWFNTAYAFEIPAVNAHGNSDASAVVTATPLPKAPDAPRNFTVTPGDGKVTLNWELPDNTTEIDRVTVRYHEKNSSNQATTVELPTDATTYEIGGLTNGTLYIFVVEVANRAGSSQTAEEASPAPPPKPDAPTGLTATAGNTTVTLTWGDPSDTSITKYQLRYGAGSSVPASATWADLASSSTTTSHTVTGLSNGTQYAFEIRAVNDGGNSDASATATATPTAPPPKPAAPTGLAATVGSGKVTLNWNNPSNNTISNYQLRYGQGATVPDNAAWGDIDGSGATTTSHTVTGLSNGTQYAFEIRAVNAGGEGAASAEVSATPMALPSQPIGLSAAAGDGQVSLRWAHPADSSISKYQLRYGAGSSVPASATWADLASSSATTTSHTVTGLSNGTQYAFEIRAVNAGGEGDVSATVTATPEEAVDNQAPVVVRPIPESVARINDTFGTGDFVLRLEEAGEEIFSDADGDDLTYSATSANSGVASIKAVDNGEIKILTVQAVSVGTVEVTLRATDPDGAWAEDKFTITVIDGSGSAHLSSFDDVTLSVNGGGREYINPPLPAFAKAGSPTFFAPIGLTVVSANPSVATAEIINRQNGAPDQKSFATFNLRVTAVGTGVTTISVTNAPNFSASVTETFTVTVAAANKAPTVENQIPDQPATVAGMFSYTFPDNTFADADGDTLAYTATQADDDNSALPSWLSFTAATRTFLGVPQASNLGTVALRVTADDGNGGTVSDDFVVTVTDAPTVTITAPDELTVGETATVTVTFSKSVTGFEIHELKVTPPTAGTLSKLDFPNSGTTYTAMLTLANDAPSTIRLSVASDVAVDSANTGNAAHITKEIPIKRTGNVQTPDTTAPTVTIKTSDAELTAGETATVTVTFSEDVTGFEKGDLTASAGSLSGFTGDGTTYTATLTPPDDDKGTITLSVAAGVAKDSAGNDNTAAEVVTLSYNTTIAMASQESLEKVNTVVLPDIIHNTVGHHVEVLTARFDSIDPLTLGRFDSSISMNLEDMANAIASTVFDYGDELANGAVDWHQALDGRSFSFSAAATSNARVIKDPEGVMDDPNLGLFSTLSFWGRADYSSFSREVDRNDLQADTEGDTFTVHIGADMQPIPKLVTGLSLAFSRSQVDWDGKDEIDGTYKVNFTTVHPYVSWFAGNWQVWISGLFGSGDAEWDPEEGGVVENSGSVSGLAGGARYRFWKSAAEEYPPSLSLKLDGATASFLGVDAKQARLSVEATRQFPVQSGELTGAASLGLRIKDDSTYGTGTAVEVGAGTTWQGERLAVSGQGRLLFGVGEQEWREWGVSGTVVYTPGSDGEGVMVSLEPSIGVTSSRQAELWNLTGSDLALGSEQEELEPRLRAELAYGLRRGAVLLTPYMELSITPSSNIYGIGVRYDLGSDVMLDLHGSHTAPVRGEGENSLEVDLNTQF